MSSANNTPQFVDVVLPLAISQLYTYAILNNQHVVKGCRVVVQLGKRKLYTAIAVRVHHEKPDYDTKPILEVIDDQPIVYPKQLDFWKWLSEYYMCSMGEVMNAAIPAGLKLESQTKVTLSPDVNLQKAECTTTENLLLEALENLQVITVEEAGKILEVQNPLRIVKNLLAKNMVLLEEEVKAQQKPTVFKHLSLAKPLSEEEISTTFNQLKNSAKQQTILLKFFDLRTQFVDEEVPENKLLKEADAAKTSLDGLIKKGILKRTESLKLAEKVAARQKLELSEGQTTAFKNIKAGFEEQKPVLLHGVTSSGKTEIYISLIKEALKTHKRALYLVPEIALTTQLINRLQLHFGQQAVVYHSRITQRERLAAYNRLITDEAPLVLLGARSAMLLPLQDLGMVVIDEEHDTSFKQQDPAPRYQARDVAIVLAKMNNCPILMGSATPSAESFYNATSGRFAMVELKERFGGVKMPDIEVVDIRKETLWKTMHGHFSPQLLKEVEEALANKKKAILFQNRRGYTPVVQCMNCAHTQHCVNCDITLTYHKQIHKLKCHYCGYTIAPPSHCPHCKSTNLKEIGFGTEKLEEELQTLLPDATIARMDLDSTRKKNAFNKLIGRFEKGEIDILIGTQMVTKGLDFDDVTLVGVLNADSMLNYPDFRAQERAFQLMEQVAGRAGRRKERGRVTIQSYKPGHRIIGHVYHHNYKQMVEQQLEERQIFHYPPFSRLIHIDLRHKDLRTLDHAAEQFAKLLRDQFKEGVLGPEYPPLRRLKGVYHKSILLKLDRNISPAKAKEYIWKVREYVFNLPPFKSVRVVFDVDPY